MYIRTKRSRIVKNLIVVIELVNYHIVVDEIECMRVNGNNEIDEGAFRHMGTVADLAILFFTE